ncbi:hypothetical protein PXH69_32550 [Rhodococcus qingshengii]|uniref:Uncharacterized protein n=1 Tax=Rhodococcus qingshengii TaxID=334542 RepID=A0AAW6LX49_RHOSG|nr:hypothetical protein [Rhodococcus qingshengii]MDE8649707.1 hypothetical protein [Rhodococcus qingshengii]
MPQVTHRFSLRASAVGAVTGVVSFTGLTIAADASSAFLCGAGAAVAALSLVVGSRHLRGSATTLAEKPDLAAGGPSRASAIDSPNAKIAAIHSVETDLAHDARIATFGLTVVDRQFRDGSYTTTSRALAPPKVLESAVGERRMATVDEVHRLPGAVVMPWRDSELQQYGTALATEIPKEIPPERTYTVPRGGIVSRQTITVCFCTAFAIFGSATGLLMPDTAALSSAISSAATSTTDIVADIGSPEINSAIGRFGLDALAAMTVMAEKDLPGSTEHVLEVTFYGFWTELVVLDETNAQRVTYHASQDSRGNYDPDRVDVSRGSREDSAARVRNTFPLSVVDPSVVLAAYDTITATLGTDQTGDDRVEISKDSPDAEPLIEVWATVNDQIGTYLATLDGTIAPIFDVRDTTVALAQVASVLPLAGIDAATPRIRTLCLACSSDEIGLTIDPAAEGADQHELSLDSGNFPTVTIDEDITPNLDELFSFSQITAAQLDAVAAANADRVGAEPADIASARFTITKKQLPETQSDTPPVLQVNVEFATMTGSDAIYLPDATFVTAD